MRKPERVALAAKMRKLLQSYGGEVIERVGINHAIETTLSGDFGRVRVTAYLPTDAKDSPWLACVFCDWDAVYPAHWKGWNHWKQNKYGSSSISSDDWVVMSLLHLRRLLHASPSAQITTP